MVQFQVHDPVVAAGEILAPGILAEFSPQRCQSPWKPLEIAEKARVSGDNPRPAASPPCSSL